MRHKWPITKLGDVLTERCEIPTDEDLASGRVRIIEKISFDSGRIQLRVGGSTKTGMILVRPGDLVVSGINAAKGAIAIYDPNEGTPVAATIHYGAYEINPQRADLRFVWWMLRSHFFQELLLEYVPGGIKSELKAKRLLPIPVPLPPLAEQQQVVTQIEELAAQIREARGLRHQAAEEAAILVPSGLAGIFERLGKTYPTSKLETLCDVVRGGSPRPAGSSLYYGGDIPFIKVGDLTKDDGMYLYEASASVNELGRKQSRFIEANTLMLTNSGATLGVPKITKIAGCFNDGSQAFLNLDSAVEKEYLYYLFKSKTFWFREQLARGQGQPNLNTDMTKQMDVPVPPLREQRRIVAELDALQAEVDALKRLQGETTTELDVLLPAVLDRAFRGGL
jgi:type I restriction enzyme S subunit